ncbi:MAG TPA: hypothetical protein VIY73_00145, partial [Polyangiaceae bacterium]
TSALGCGPSCLVCAGSASGSVCVNGGCGCAAATDCPADEACDLTAAPNPTCSGSCGIAAKFSACNGGCCQPLFKVPGGSCVAGTSSNECGANGGTCSACGGTTPTCSATGACAPCLQATDCPPGDACDVTTGTCSVTCAGPDSYSGCNGGCCESIPTSVGGSCVAGTAQIACGDNGAACINCQITKQTCNASFVCQ